MAIEFSEFALAEKFAVEYVDQFGFLWEWERWYSRLSNIWTLDIDGRVYDRIRAICEAESKRCEDASMATHLASWHTVKGVEHLARLSMRLETEDRRPYRIGEFRPPEYISARSMRHD